MTARCLWTWTCRLELSAGVSSPTGLSLLPLAPASAGGEDGMCLGAGEEPVQGPAVVTAGDRLP
jgi:hypothetical protein